MGMCAYFAAVDNEQIARFSQDPDQVSTFLYPADPAAGPAHTVDIDKAWHAIHFLLNDSASMDGSGGVQAIFGGEPIGPDLAYGPARVLHPAEVRAIAAALSGVGETEMRARFSSERLAEADIYPGVWDDPEADLDYVLHSYLRLARFYADAAQRGDGALLYIS